MNEIADKMNEAAEENRPIKQAVLGTYEKMKSRYPVLRSRNQNSSKGNSDKQVSKSGKKSIQFKSNTSTGTGHSSAVTHSGIAMHLILKLNPSLATSTNSVSTIAKETESQLEAEAEGQTHNLSSDCSDSDSDELTYADE